MAEDADSVTHGGRYRLCYKLLVFQVTPLYPSLLNSGSVPPTMLVSMVELTQSETPWTLKMISDYTEVVGLSSIFSIAKHSDFSSEYVKIGENVGLLRSQAVEVPLNS